MKKLLLNSYIFIFSFFLVFNSVSFGQWMSSLGSAGQIWAIAVNQSSSQIIYAGSNTTGIWKTNDGGFNWSQSNSGLTNLTVQAIAISRSDPNVLFAGTSQTGTGAGIYKSTDAGANWIQVNSGIVETSLGIQSIAIDHTNPNVAYVAVFDGLVDSPQGLYKTTNGGTNWNIANSGIGTIKNFLTIAINPMNTNVVYCGSSFGVTSQMGPSKIYKSIDAGSTWNDISTGLPSLTTDVKPVRCISISTLDTAVLLAGLFLNTDSLGGMFVSTNGGQQWIRRHNGIPNLVNTLIRSCLIRPGSSTEFYAGLGNATNSGIGVYRSTNAGVSWIEFNSGVMNNTISVRALNYSSLTGRILAGAAHPTVTTGQGLFYYEFPSGIGNQNSSLPEAFKLNQNYPNPFNPVTTLSYSIPSVQHTMLKVYDVNGKLVSTLVNEIQSAGEYKITFNGNGLSSGVYFYELVSGNFTDTKTMMIIK